MYDKEFILIYILTSILLLRVPIAASDVLEITDRDFHQQVNRFDYALVLFHVPWCKRSKKLLPEFAKAAEEIASFTDSIGLLKVDCTENSEEICRDFTTDDLYPALRTFKDGVFLKDYQGPRMWYDLVKYMKAQTKPTSIELFSQKDVEYFLKQRAMEASVVGYFSSSSLKINSFKKIAEELKTNLDFAHISFPKENPSKDKIVLYRPLLLVNKFENASVVFSGGIGNLPNFIFKHMYGLVGVRKLDNQNYFSTPSVVTYFFIDFTLNPKLSQYWRNRVLLVAKNFTNVTFAISRSEDFPEELESVGIDPMNVEKPVVIAKATSDRKYILQQEFSVEALAKFVNDFLKGKLKPFVKSEEVPAAQTGPVLKAVAENFETLVEQNNRDTLVKFYAPWCYHCKNLVPVYEEIAGKLQDEDVDFVEMNAEANDIPSQYTVNGYPTIYWVGKNNKNTPLKYEGERTVEDFLEFVAKQATEELNGWDREGKTKRIKSEL